MVAKPCSRDHEFLEDQIKPEKEMMGNGGPLQPTTGPNQSQPCVYLLRLPMPNAVYAAFFIGPVTPETPNPSYCLRRLRIVFGLPPLLALALRSAGPIGTTLLLAEKPAVQCQFGLGAIRVFHDSGRRAKHDSTAY